MKVRHIKRRATKPTFRIVTLFPQVTIEFNGPDGVTRFFGTDPEEYEQSLGFFGGRISGIRLEAR